VLCGDAQRQRQAGAQSGKLGQVSWGVSSAASPGDLAYESDRVVFLEDVQSDTLRTIPDRQAGELVPACNDHKRTGTARDERAHLGNIRHVVEHDQHPAAGDEGAEQGSAAIKVTGN